jgi:hypothetical protein
VLEHAADEVAGDFDDAAGVKIRPQDSSAHYRTSSA